ncbi:MAG: hypothetical protein E6K70_18025 [Planctomycetota bacterium]|nr:MAG: hypothetical protein E6K70_18025 [Planctomycetota bacterium]
MFCRHCQCRRANRPRGLCWSCFSHPAIRECYPPAGKFGRRAGPPDFYGPALPPTAPTRALPGTAEKIAVLAQRASLRQELWHPRDAPWCEAADAG